MTEAISVLTANEIVKPIMAAIDGVSRMVEEIEVGPSAPAAAQLPESNVTSSPEIDKLMAALSKAQGQIRNPMKDSANPHFNSRYADLAGGLTAIRAAFSANELAPVQTAKMRAEMMVLYTRIYHSSGQWIETEWPIGNPRGGSQQALGSSLTYARRYSLFALAGIAGEEDDDDGELSAGREPAKASQRPASTRPASSKAKADAEPKEPSMTAEESAAATGAMLATLNACDTRAGIVRWAEDNFPTKERLLPADQEKVKIAFNERQTEVKKAKAPKADESEKTAA